MRAAARVAPGILDAEVDDSGALAVPFAPEIGDRRIVGVEDKTRAAGAGGDGCRPVFSQDLELAVAIELIAEEVAENHHRRIELLCDLWEPGLVDLEETLFAALLEQRRGHAPGHVRAGPVVHRSPSVGGHRGSDHPSGRRLAVGGADDRRATGQA
jgi:hypothetical protein